MKKLLHTFVLLSFMFMGCSTHEDNTDESVLTAFDEIMLERGYKEYSLTNNEFLDVYSILELYTYEEDYYKIPKSKEIFSDFIGSYEFKYGVSTELEEYKVHLNGYYESDGTVQNLLNEVLMHKNNKQYIQIKDKDILIYKQNNQYIIEMTEPFIQLYIDVDKQMVIYEDTSLFNFESTVLYLLNGAMNTEDVYIKKEENLLGVCL